MNDKPIFIVGCARSGTTLIQYMLRSHPRISLPTGESHFIVPIYQNQDQYGDLRKQKNVRSVLEEMYQRSGNFLETDLHGINFDIDSMTKLIVKRGCKTVPEIFSTIYEENAKGEGKERWGEKTPWYLFHMPLISEMFPGAQFIHIIRDGRDVALSLFGRRHEFSVYNIHRAAEFWVIFLERGQQLGAQMSPSVYIEVRYEDLLYKPEETVRSICDFLGEEYSDDVIHFRTSTEAGKTPLLQKPIQKTNAYKWKNQLNKRQIEVFEGVAYSVLKRNGYELVSNCQHITIFEKMFYRFHNALFDLIYKKLFSLK